MITNAHAIVLAGCRLSITTWMTAIAIITHRIVIPIIYSNEYITLPLAS
jgi:hypothetical protein